MISSDKDHKTSSESKNKTQLDNEDEQIKELSIKLVKQCKLGDRDAFNQLVNIYRNKVYALIYNMIHSQEDAWDLTQDTFLKAWKAMPKFREESSFFTWIYRISHNTCYDWHRKNSKRYKTDFDENVFNNDLNISSTPPSKNIDPIRALKNKELLKYIKKALSELSFEHRSVIILKEVNGMSYKEIAKVLGCSVGTVMSRIFYSRKQLQIKLKDFYNG